MRVEGLGCVVYGLRKGERQQVTSPSSEREREARDNRLRALRAREREKGERQQVTSPSSEREREASDDRLRALRVRERERRETTGYEPFECERERGRHPRGSIRGGRGTSTGGCVAGARPSIRMACDTIADATLVHALPIVVTLGIRQDSFR